VLAPMALAVVGGVYIHLTQLAAVLPLAFVVFSRTRSPLAWAGIALLTVPWNLLEAFTPTTLIVPRAADVVSRAATHHGIPGELAYAANVLVYAGVVCVLVAALRVCRSRRTAFS
jgi:hypothetical protein